MSIRRCTQREFLLRPDSGVNGVLGYLMGYCQSKYQFKCHFLTAMSSHAHKGITDSGRDPQRSELSNIMRDFHALSARAINVWRGRTENLWSAGGDTFNFVAAITTEDMIHHFVYGITNPVEAGLVSSHKKWPGLVLHPGPTGRRTYRFRKPSFFFSDDMPEFTELVLEAPDCELAPAEFMKRVLEQVNNQEERIRAKFRIQGRKFLGVKRVLKQSPISRPATHEHWAQDRPQVSTSDRWRRLERICANQRFLREYESCLERYRGGDTEAVFPLGTYKMVEYFGVRCVGWP